MRQFGWFFVFFACGSSTQQPPPPASIPQPELAHSSSPPPPIANDPRVERMLKKVSLVRGLTAKRSVPGVTLERDALLARVKDHVGREVPHQAIVDEGRIYQLLGEMPTQYDYEKGIFTMLEAQLAGYYEPADGTMYMAKDLEGPMADITLSHELVHALQDQNFDLKSKSKYMPGQGDYQTALSALAEGDATSSMIDVALDGQKTATDVPNELFSKLIRSGMTGADMGDAPRVMSAELIAPYIDGTMFVNELRRRGGWSKVDDAWRDPPASTEQILHVDKWFSHEAPVAVPAPTASALGSAWTAASTDTLGELTWRTVLEEWMPAQRAQMAAANWGGDRCVLFHNADQSAFAWRVRYDAASPNDDAFATNAFAAIAPTVAKSGDPNFACRARSDRGPLAIARKGRDLVILAGPADTAKWASIGDCALSKKWATEILK